MEFKLNEFHGNVSNQELLDDVTRVAQMLNTRVLYQSHWSFSFGQNALAFYFSVYIISLPHKRAAAVFFLPTADR